MSTTTTRFENLVAGEWRPSESGNWLEVQNPADLHEVVAEVPAMSHADVSQAFDAANEGARVWAATSPITRGRVLLRTAQLLRERVEQIAHDLTREMGKTLAEARGEVGKAADFFEYYGGISRAPAGELLADERKGVRVWTQREPVGVVLAISPWNDPLLTPARKIAPTLIAGNSVLLKPATYTPVVSLHLARALDDAGLPAGVAGTVTGSSRDISEPLLSHPALAAVSFTGSNAVGESIQTTLAGTHVKLLAELGGKNATVVLGDADLDAATATITAAAFAQAGQRCTATSRVIVERSVVAQMRERLTAAAGKLVLGPGLDPTTTMGPVVSRQQKDEIEGFITRALNAGAETIMGSDSLDDPRLASGCFVTPTILGVDTDSEIWREEVFGPVIALVAVDGVDEAIELVNDSGYGLASAVFTRSLASTYKFIDGVATGQVGVNLPTSGWDVHMPFGGYKASGSGSKEQGLEALDFYTRVKTVAVAL